MKMDPAGPPHQLLLLGAGHAHVQVLAHMAGSPWANVRVTLIL